MTSFRTSLAYFSSCQLTRVERGAGPLVLWLRGDRDIPTEDALAKTIAEAIALGEPAVVVDLGDVHFLSAATLRVFVEAQETLEAQSRALVLNVPSASARRIFEVSGLSDLLDQESSGDAIETVEGATRRVDWHDTSVTLQPNVGEQVSVEAAHAPDLGTATVQCVASPEGIVSLDTPSLNDFSSCRLSRAGPGGKLSVVWLAGEHDISTRDVLAATLAEAISLDEPAVVIDLSGVHFISVATIAMIADAKKVLARRGRSLVLRAPPPFVRQVFHVCGLSDLLNRDPSAGAFETVEGATALRSWVEVPATDRVDWHDTPVNTEHNVGERVSVEAAGVR